MNRCKHDCITSLITAFQTNHYSGIEVKYIPLRYMIHTFTKTLVKQNAYHSHKVNFLHSYHAAGDGPCMALTTAAGTMGIDVEPCDGVPGN